MKDYYKIPVHVEGCRTEYGSGKHRLLIDACQLAPDLYEVIAMRPTGAEIELRRFLTVSEARADYARMVEQYKNW